MVKRVNFITIFVTAPVKSVDIIIDKVLSLKLVACVNVIKNIKSVYFWQGKRCSEKESLLIMKTKYELFSKTVKEIKKVHPYTVPEIICLPLLKGNKEYFNWIDEVTL
jgi:periplasmic divalent cation tolerance protein